MATLNDEYGDIHDAAIYVQGNVIRWIGNTADIPEELQKADTVLSLPDRVVIPGLVCCHHHMYQVHVNKLLKLAFRFLLMPLLRQIDRVCCSSIGQCMSSCKLSNLHGIAADYTMLQGLTRLRGTNESLYGWWEACLPAWCQLKVKLITS